MQKNKDLSTKKISIRKFKLKYTRDEVVKAVSHPYPAMDQCDYEQLTVLKNIAYTALGQHAVEEHFRQFK